MHLVYTSQGLVKYNKLAVIKLAYMIDKMVSTTSRLCVAAKAHVHLSIPTYTTILFRL
jgi:hypothetical protein